MEGKEKVLNQFLENEENEEEKKDKNVDEETKRVVLEEREGLIERVDKILVTQDGKQLLREQY